MTASQATVLVVDDEEAMRDACLQVLGRAGYEVIVAENGETGLEVLRRRRPEVVLIDLKMPGMSGQEFLRRLREESPETVPVVITGYATLESAVESIKEGAYDFLAKPFTPDGLRVIVRRGLDRHDLVRRLAALERDKERMREQFAAMISHQLRSPLVAVAGQLEVLGRGLAGDLNPKVRGIVERMDRRVAQLLELIDDWTLLSGTEGVRLDATAREVELGALVREVASRAVDEARAGGTRTREVAVESEPAESDFQVTSAPARAAGRVPVVTVTVEPDRAVVRGDERLLAEMIGNLVSNAIKYTDASGRVTVRLEADGSTFAVTVADTGIGIPESEMPYIFEDFFRGTEARKRGGTGLGLAVARRVAHLHGGSISVTSQAGIGSTFVVRLPRAQSDQHSAVGDQQRVDNQKEPMVRDGNHV